MYCFIIFLHLISSFSLTRSLFVPYAYVSIESIDCILLSSSELKAILLISSVKRIMSLVCLSLLNFRCAFNINLLLFMNYLLSIYVSFIFVLMIYFIFELSCFQTVFLILKFSFLFMTYFLWLLLSFIFTTSLSHRQIHLGNCVHFCFSTDIG